MVIMFSLSAELLATEWYVASVSNNPTDILAYHV